MFTRRSFLASLAALGLPSSLIGSVAPTVAPSTAPISTGYLGHVYGGDASSRMDFCRSFCYYYEKHLRAINAPYRENWSIWFAVDGMANWQLQKAGLLSTIRQQSAHAIVIDVKVPLGEQFFRQWHDIFDAAYDSDTIVLVTCDRDNQVKFMADFRVLLDGDPTMVKWRRVPEWVRDCWTGRPIGV